MRKRQCAAAAQKGSGGSFNPFQNKQKEDAARKALQEMFKGKDDALAAYDGNDGGKTIAAVALFAGVLLGVPLLRQVPRLAIAGARWVLRLDGRGSRRRRRPAPGAAAALGDDLGPAEAAVIAKYGAVEEQEVTGALRVLQKERV
ncbi:hypothetical protein WJX81_005176 [Elliptochloris bilobata]|uniref:Uncharacterized protein n=1 Tax=Elliptochloris bilobata TaxID=381761 RepID=A0AAW1R1X6_9CHLO